MTELHLSTRELILGWYFIFIFISILVHGAEWSKHLAWNSPTSAGSKASWAETQQCSWVLQPSQSMSYCSCLLWLRWPLLWLQKEGPRITGLKRETWPLLDGWKSIVYKHTSSPGLNSGVAEQCLSANSCRMNASSVHLWTSSQALLLLWNDSLTAGASVNNNGL